MSTDRAADLLVVVACAACLVAACGATETELPGDADAGSGDATLVSDTAPAPDSVLPDTGIDTAVETDATDANDAVDDATTIPPDIAITDATPTACPRVSIRCGVRGSAAEPVEGGLEADPFDLVYCEARSADPLPDDATVVWRLAERPDGSVTDLDVSSGPTTELFLDAIGAYHLEAEVERVATCGRVEPALATIVTLAPPGIAATLVWTLETPPDEFEASDLDLHLLHPSGCWEDETWDVHFRNHHPNWGDRTRSDDDPSMDIDAQGEGRVEAVVYVRPEVGLNYRIGVHYWNDHGQGAADAKLALHVAGALVPVPSRRLTHGQFWEVALVSWPSAEVTLIDRVYDAIADAPCSTSP